MRTGKIGSIDIGNRNFYINSVLSFLDSLVTNHKELDYERYNRFRFVVSDLVRLRVEKAYPGTNGSIHVDVSLTEHYLEVAIIDKGIPYWIDKSTNAAIIESLGEITTRNQLYRFMTDGLGMENLGKDGQKIFVRLNIHNRIEFDEPEPYPETNVLDTNITIKPVATKKDALEAIRCIYSEYGYSYSYQKFYYIDSFLKAIEDKEILSFLAVNDHGQTAGHFALVFSDTFKGMPEISTVVTRKEFRGLGLFGKFIDYSKSLAKEYNFRALMGQPVAFHPFSQKAFIKAGFSATSILLSYIHSDIESEYNINNERLDLFAAVKILDKNSSCVIYPPTELTPFIEKILTKLEYKHTIKTEKALADTTHFSSKSNRSLKSTQVIFTKVGADFEELLNETIKDSIHGKNEMMEILISLNEPCCEYAYNITKKKGFNFSGILPGAENCDYIIMQMMIGSDCTYNHLVSVGEYEELTADITSLNKGRYNL